MLSDSYTFVLTVYMNTRVDIFDECLQSVLAQTVSPVEVIIVEDGEITGTLDTYLAEQTACSKVPIRRIHLDANSGPGPAAQAGIDESRTDLIARLDSDDVAVAKRIETQLAVFKQYPTLVAVGSWVREFSGDISNVVALVELPRTPKEIQRFARRRCPWRQSSVLYKKSAISQVGGYADLRFGEDWDLYNRFIQAGLMVYNIPEVLTFMRADSDFFKRRGGVGLLHDLLKFKYSMLRAGQCGWLDFLISSASSVVICLVPNYVRVSIYKKFARRTA